MNRFRALSVVVRQAASSQRAKAVGGTLLVVGTALLPAFGALFQLAAQLDAIDRMHREAEGPPTMEPIATYEADPSTGEASMRLHSVVVRR
jgi:hypothetical protein